MPGRHSARQHSGTCQASGNGACADLAHFSPHDNRLLALLPKREYERLLPALEPWPLPAGRSIYSAGDRRSHLYFVTAGLASRCYVTKDGATAAFAVTGTDGVIGVASFLGGQSMPTQADVLCAGHSYRMAIDRLNVEFEHDGPLPRLLLRYAMTLIAQTAQMAVCNRRHRLDQRLCRWLLSCVDRLPSDELTLTHERLAAMLGVRRESVTEAVGQLQNAGLIHCSRGHIAVLDRPGLEAAACECYASLRREQERVLLAGLAVGTTPVPRARRWARAAFAHPAAA